MSLGKGRYYKDIMNSDIEKDRITKEQLEAFKKELRREAMSSTIMLGSSILVSIAIFVALYVFL